MSDTIQWVLIVLIFVWLVFLTRWADSMQDLAMTMSEKIKAIFGWINGEKP